MLCTLSCHFEKCLFRLCWLYIVSANTSMTWFCFSSWISFERPNILVWLVVRWSETSCRFSNRVCAIWDTLSLSCLVWSRESFVLKPADCWNVPTVRLTAYRDRIFLGEFFALVAYPLFVALAALIFSNVLSASMSHFGSSDLVFIKKRKKRKEKGERKRHCRWESYLK